MMGLFLDRDGILLESSYVAGQHRSARSVSEMRLIAGVRESLELLAAHMKLIVVTNQPDVARGLLDSQELERMHAELKSLLPPLTAVFYCPHDDSTSCDCRKPRPGMLLSAARQYGLDLRRSWMVGDRWSDVCAGKAAGCRTAFVNYQYAEPLTCSPDFAAQTASAALSTIQQMLSNESYATQDVSPR